MNQMSVTQFAGELRMPAAVLLEQLQKAGVEKQGAEDLLSEQDKARLLEYLRRSHGETAPKAKITLTRKQTSEIKATDSTGRARTVQVEVRKKRVFVKRDELLAEAEAEAEAELEASAEPAVEVAEVDEPLPATPEPQAELPAEPEAAPEPEPTPVEEAAVAEAEPTQEVVSAAETQPEPESAESARLTMRDVLGEEELAARERERQRAADLAARQAADLKEKQEREARARAAAEARRAEEEASRKQAAEAQAKGTTGTLHKPDKPPAKERKDAKRGSGWQDDSSRRRGGLKTRGSDVGGAWKVGREVVAAVVAAPSASNRPSRHRPSRSCVRSTCPRPSRSPTSLTRWRSRPPKSSRQ